VLKVKEKELGIFTITQRRVREYLFSKRLVYTPPEVWEIEEAELTSNGIRLTFCYILPWNNRNVFRGTYHHEFKVKLERDCEAILEKAKNNEITSWEAFDLVGQEIHRSGIQVITFDENQMLRLIYDIKLPSFWSSSFKLGAWAGPKDGQKFTKVELTTDSLEFTLTRMEVP
jgi:hypothetical protein